MFGIPAGYPSGNLTVTPNMFHGAVNDGEWYPQGTNVGSIPFTSERQTVHNFNLDDPNERFTGQHNPVLVTGRKIGLDNPDDPLAGAAYDLVRINADGSETIIGNAVSDANGFVQFEVEPGFQHCFEETIAPGGYQVDTIPRCTPEGGVLLDIDQARAVLLADQPIDAPDGPDNPCLNGLPCTGAEDSPVLGWLAGFSALAGAALIFGTRTGCTEEADAAVEEMVS